jgi:hypothetical protein
MRTPHHQAGTRSGRETHTNFRQNVLDVCHSGSILAGGIHEPRNRLMQPSDISSQGIDRINNRKISANLGERHAAFKAVGVLDLLVKDSAG